MKLKEKLAFLVAIIIDTLVLGLSITLGVLSVCYLFQGQYSGGEEILLLISLYIVSVAIEKVIDKRFPEVKSVEPVLAEYSDRVSAEVIKEINAILLEDINTSRKKHDWLTRPNLNFGGSRPVDVINSGREIKVLWHLRAERDGY